MEKNLGRPRHLHHIRRRLDCFSHLLGLWTFMARMGLQLLVLDQRLFFHFNTFKKYSISQKVVPLYIYYQNSILQSRSKFRARIDCAVQLCGPVPHPCRRPLVYGLLHYRRWHGRGWRPPTAPNPSEEGDTTQSNAQPTLDLSDSWQGPFVHPSGLGRRRVLCSRLHAMAGRSIASFIPPGPGGLLPWWRAHGLPDSHHTTLGPVRHAWTPSTGPSPPCVLRAQGHEAINQPSHGSRRPRPFPVGNNDTFRATSWIMKVWSHIELWKSKSILL
jgi:hypothetical protein